MGKYIFFDVDGTLVPFGKKPSLATLSALQKAKNSGHKILLATGRVPAEIDTSVLNFDFDGGVYASGAYIEYEGEVLFRSYFNLNEVSQIFSYARDNDMDLMLQTLDGSFLTPQFRRTLKNLFISSFGQPLSVASLKEEVSLKQRPDITKIIIHSSGKTISEIRRELSPCFGVIDNTMGVPADFTAELTQKGLNKATGIACFERLLGLDHSQIIAMGDGANDKEMIAFAGIGIAMGNGGEIIKELSDYVTADVHEDGVSQALRHFNLI